MTLLDALEEKLYTKNCIIDVGELYDLDYNTTLEIVARENNCKILTTDKHKDKKDEYKFINLDTAYLFMHYEKYRLLVGTDIDVSKLPRCLRNKVIGGFSISIKEVLTDDQVVKKLKIKRDELLRRFSEGEDIKIDYLRNLNKLIQEFNSR